MLCSKLCRYMWTFYALCNRNESRVSFIFRLQKKRVKFNSYSLFLLIYQHFSNLSEIHVKNFSQAHVTSAPIHMFTVQRSNVDWTRHIDRLKLTYTKNTSIFSLHRSTAHTRGAPTRLTIFARTRAQSRFQRRHHRRRCLPSIASNFQQLWTSHNVLKEFIEPA